MDEAELSAVRDFVDPSVFQWLFSDGSLESDHSIRKTTVQKLKKAEVNATDIMAITGHKNQQSLTDYRELDEADHCKIGEILSNDVGKSAVKSISPQVPVLPPKSTQIQPSSSLVLPASAPVQTKSTDEPVSALAAEFKPNPTHSSGPVFHFNNSTVLFFGSSTSNTCNQQYKHTELASNSRKRFLPDLD